MLLPTTRQSLRLASCKEGDLPNSMTKVTEYKAREGEDLIFEDESFHKFVCEFSSLTQTIASLRDAREQLSSEISSHSQERRISREPTNVLTINFSDPLKLEKRNQGKNCVASTVWSTEINVDGCGDTGDECGDGENCYQNDEESVIGHESDEDGDDDNGYRFLCPFCDLDIDIQVLCSHMHDEHCFDLKNAVCPICAASLEEGVMKHFIVRHAGFIKHRQRGLSAALGSFLNDKPNISEVVPDELSPFLCNLTCLDSVGRAQKEASKESDFRSKRTGEQLSVIESNKLDANERMKRAAFVQELVASTLF